MQISVTGITKSIFEISIISFIVLQNLSYSYTGSGYKTASLQYFDLDANDGLTLSPTYNLYPLEPKDLVTANAALLFPSVTKIFFIFFITVIFGLIFY